MNEAKAGGRIDISNLENNVWQRHGTCSYDISCMQSLTHHPKSLVLFFLENILSSNVGRGVCIEYLETGAKKPVRKLF